jgi:hypothetical protein
MNTWEGDGGLGGAPQAHGGGGDPVATDAAACAGSVGSTRVLSGSPGNGLPKHED